VKTGPVYKASRARQAVGYTDQQLTANRYRVTFTGRNTTKREEVEETIWLRRAAEVTLDAGYTHFVFDTRNTEAKTYYRQDFDTFSIRIFVPDLAMGHISDSAPGIGRLGPMTHSRPI